MRRNEVLKGFTGQPGYYIRPAGLGIKQQVRMLYIVGQAKKGQQAMVYRETWPDEFSELAE